MLFRVRGGGALHASIGTPPLSFRPSLISPLFVRHRVMSSTDFKQVRFILHTTFTHADLFTFILPGTSQVSS